MCLDIKRAGPPGEDPAGDDALADHHGGGGAYLLPWSLLY